MQASYVLPFPKLEATVQVRTNGGGEFHSGLVGPKWNKECPPTDTELEGKFRWLAEPVMGKPRTDELIETVWNMENVSDVSELICLCIKT